MLSGAAEKIHWIELVVGFSCNCRCLVCPSAKITGEASMSSREIALWLDRGRRMGAEGVWFGGGEPTLHPSLAPAIDRARRLGYRRIRIQTNCMRLAYPEFADKVIAAGATELSVLIAGADAGTHNQMTQDERSFELMVAGIRNLVSRGARVEGDLLMTTSSMGAMAEAVDRFADLGVLAFTFWLVSLHGLSDPDLARMVPPMPALMPHLLRAFDRAGARGVGATTLHTPPCVLPPPCRPRYLHCGRWRLLVVTPGGESFLAEQSPIEGGVYLDGCETCSLRPDCLGLRRDYLELHGPSAFTPVRQGA